MFRLRDLSAGARIGFTALCVVFFGGLLASAAHMVMHYENRDERPGLTLDDIRAQYHGLQSTSPILKALARNHPPELERKHRDTLVAWLSGSRITEEYDDLDLGDAAPAEIIARNCVECHSRRAPEAQAEARRLPLEYWDDVKKVAFSRQINRTPDRVIVASLHAHALGLGAMSAAIALLAAFTAWPRRLVGGLVGLSGVALLADLSGQWLARTQVGFVYMIVGGGAAYALSTSALLLLVLGELWRPRRAG